MKYCWHCQKYKEPEEFYRNRSRKDGLNTECKDCCKKLSNDYNKNNYEKIQQSRKKSDGKRIEARKKKYAEQSDELRILRRLPNRRFQLLKAGAKSRKINFNLSYVEYLLISSKPCYYCGGSLLNVAGASIDRINNDKSIGYTVDNSLPCCGICNQTRNIHWSVEETKVMIQAALQYRNEHK